MKTMRFTKEQLKGIESRKEEYISRNKVIAETEKPVKSGVKHHFGSYAGDNGEFYYPKQKGLIVPGLGSEKYLIVFGVLNASFQNRVGAVVRPEDYSCYTYKIIEYIR
jgi:hypothetical protein